MSEQPQRREQQEWTPHWERVGNIDYYIPQATCDKHNAALAAERQKRADWNVIIEDLEKDVREMNGYVKQAKEQLLSAQAAIEKSNKGCSIHSSSFINDNLSALREHDAEVRGQGWDEGREHERKCQAAIVAAVRKPFVEALELLQTRVETRGCQAIIESALAKVKEQETWDDQNRQLIPHATRNA